MINRDNRPVLLDYPNPGSNVFLMMRRYGFFRLAIHWAQSSVLCCTGSLKQTY